MKGRTLLRGIARYVAPARTYVPRTRSPVTPFIPPPAHVWRSFGSYLPAKTHGLVNPTIVTRKLSSATLASLSVGSSKEAGALVVAGDAAQRRVALWLFGCSGWVFSMVVLGGVTRLTRSGLSMTDWKFAGGLPPITREEWEVEFAKYQASPEYRRINKGMSLEQFKFIYWMEYAHRMWGRALGLVFAGPFAYFIAKGYITRPLGLRLSALMAMGAGQGFVGWWMVKSGLEEPETEYAQPRVSPYRLAAHLTSAFVIYSGLFWTALSVAMPEPPSAVNKLMLDASRRIRALALPVAGLVGLTAVSGAFVAGNDAGHAYNTFPKMGDTWIPEGIFEMSPFIRNFFENTATVQMDHRILAVTTLTSIGGLWLAARHLPLNPAVKIILDATLGMAVLQVSLGVSTLLMYVPVSLGSAHQAGALTLFTVVLTLLHALRRPSPAGLRALNNSINVAGSKQLL
ncbi:heme a synthase [Marchantia polymorpha subsp. ruderalis]|uniref:Cytochrome c oxidase assembly protein COX15 n=3 Tax=Marchantia polymorpha TaxID=3197 RepID=A0AAF6BCV2_MARPO|nr:hypothetical protein MARPO_0020s0071 [Marchantia polymorpha]PTQ44413.1 hypothetical protein MARPO_0020s0071 [Marchantia polymorpha]BBN09835.1 hypothetical protein Mp_4g23080 [Marchantia polymorpha subsp. ruderalis]BBN09836.1 hypothetical protein Mp_4g23080 [Marchantia polymorpha subsp. ruderalis]|eukprot:PTQ44412.1 hypothetical protein MARPO_0020s0071 [Marchantia polymorpha]